jgi:hypothetical protein
VLDYVTGHAVDFWLTSEDLPHPGQPGDGDRAGRIRLHYTDHDTEGHRRLLRKLRGLLRHLQDLLRRGKPDFDPTTPEARATWQASHATPTP